MHLAWRIWTTAMALLLAARAVRWLAEEAAARYVVRATRIAP